MQQETWDIHSKHELDSFSLFQVRELMTKLVEARRVVSWLEFSWENDFGLYIQQIQLSLEY